MFELNKRERERGGGREREREREWGASSRIVNSQSNTLKEIISQTDLSSKTCF